jgi:hypothetical protein
MCSVQNVECEWFLDSSAMGMRLKRLLWILPAVLIISETVWGQKPAPPDPRLVTIRINRTAGPPDSRVSAQLALTAAQAGAKIGRLQAELTFPTALLTFGAAETSGLSDGVSATLKTETRADARDAATTHLFVSLSTLESSKQPFPDGVLAYLIFHISKDAKLATSIPVRMSATAISVDTPPKPVQPMTVQGNNVEVSAEAIIHCFFYMH